MRTRSEKLLGVLAKQTFLSLWAVCNPYRDSPDPKVPNKEICDLLVVFGDDIIVFSDKEIAFQADKPIETAWSRWYRKAVVESAKQLFGAKKWLMGNPGRVFLDATCRQSFAFSLPRPENARIHLVVVARGASEACAAYFGERGTLMVTNEGDVERDPFTLGQPDMSKGFVHVWDDLALEILLDHVDTTADLVSYLRAKEAFFTSGPQIHLSGEEEALALYFANPSKVGYDFPKPNPEAGFDGIFYEGGMWDDLVASSEYRSWKAEVEASKAWDYLIERSILYSPHGPKTWGKSITLSESEYLLRMLAGTNRFERRLFVAKVSAMAEDPKASKYGSMHRFYCHPFRPGQPYFTFLIMPEKGAQPWKETYRETRQVFLKLQMNIVKANNPDAIEIVGLAMNTVSDGHCSEDYAVLDARIWTDEMQKHAEEFQALTGIFVDSPEERLQIKDFEPIPPFGEAKKVSLPRNQPNQYE